MARSKAAKREPRSDSLREHLRRIESYMRGCQLLRFPRERSPIRSELGAFMRRVLPEVLDEWLAVVGEAYSIPRENWPDIRRSMYEAQMRWIVHIEDPSDVATYRYLRNHARGGFISQFPSSRFLAGQMKARQIIRAKLIEEYAPDPDKTRELVALLDQEFQERILHITDFFVEARVKELHEQEVSYRQTIDNAPAAIFQIDFEDGTVTDANRVAARVTRTPCRELIGRKAWELHPADEREAAHDLWQRTRRLKHTVSEDLHLLRRNAEPIPVFINSGVIEYGRHRFIQRICVDLSERKKLESQLVQSEKMAAIGQLAAGVAHEIRNPLGAIRNALYDLKEILAEGPAEAKDDLHIAEEELVRAKAIIDNLLEFSRVSHNDVEPVDLNDMLRRTLLLMNRYLQNSDVRVKTDFGDVPHCLVNQNAMRQVVLNLITNAVQAMPGGGELALRTRTTRGRNGGRWITLEVADEGVGIPADHLKNIFNPFFTTKEPGQGTGLGLSVVDSIIRQSHGEIHVESKVGEGTIFRVELPCNCPPEEPAGAARA